jgi:transposase InsO family protein
MPWSEVSVRDQRIAFLRATRAPGAVFGVVCAQFGISRKTGYKWRKREHEAGSVTALANQSRRPHRSPQQVAAAVEAHVVTLRRATGWAGEKLALVLARQGVPVSPRTADRIIQRRGLTHADAGAGAAPRRFARARPNELWQVDAKGHYPLPGGGRCHPLGVLDDCSRYAVGLVALPTLSTAAVQTALRACFERVGVPTAMLFDHGTPWWSPASGSGLTRLTVWLLEQDVRLLYSGRRHPQTQGKIERFHRTIGERLRRTAMPTYLRDFVRTFAIVQQEYNEVRPHRALASAVPAARYTPSPRTFQPTPREWDYGPDVALQTVRPDGQCRVAGQLAFVSEALAGKRVALEPWADDRVLIRYRQMYVREVDLRHRHSRSLLQAVDTLPAVLPMS